MLPKSSSPLIGRFDKTVACRSDLCAMPTSPSRVRRTHFCSLCLSHGRVIVGKLGGTALHAGTRAPLDGHTPAC